MQILEVVVIPLLMTILQSQGTFESNLSVFRIIRISRLARIGGIIRWFPEILTLLKGIGAALKSMFATSLLLALLTFVFGILFATLSELDYGLQVLNGQVDFNFPPVSFAK